MTLPIRSSPGTGTFAIQRSTVVTVNKVPTILAQSIWIMSIPELEHIDIGMVPINSGLSSKYKRVSCVRFPNVDGIVPDN